MEVLKDKVAIVTGASSGIGREISRLFAFEGAEVVMIYSSDVDGGDQKIKESLQGIAEGKALPYDLDIKKVEEYQKLAHYVETELGRLDILVNNAGICNFSAFDQVTPDLWDRTQETNLKSAFFLSQNTIPIISKNQPDHNGLRGSIINMSSISAVRGGIQQHHYSPTKAGLNSLTICLSESAGPLGIRVNAIAPGTIITDINRDVLESNSEATDLMRRNIPLKRLGQPEEVAQVALFLADESMSSYVNGAIIDVNGGWGNVLAGQTS